MQCAADRFVTDQFKTFFDQMLGQVQASPNRKRLASFSGILLNRFFQCFSTLASYFWADAHDEGDPPGLSVFRLRIDQTNTALYLLQIMSALQYRLHCDHSMKTRSSDTLCAHLRCLSFDRAFPTQFFHHPASFVFGGQLAFCAPSASILCPF